MFSDMIVFVVFSEKLYPGSSPILLEQFLRAIGEADSQTIVLSKSPE